VSRMQRSIIRVTTLHVRKNSLKSLTTGVLFAFILAGFGSSAFAGSSNPSSHAKFALARPPVAQATATATPDSTSSAAPATTNPNTMSTAAPPSAAPAAGVPAANFGAAPSGQVPILFNDHHVYSKPDRLKQGRVLAALVRGGTILIPLRLMFEQMGATVAYDAATRTADVSKPGSDVKVTVGRPQVTINGESRPLDVAPEIFQGHVLVPVRVISEGMGAYVQWLADRKTVIVRYLSASPPPPTAPGPPAPITSPAVSPPAAPTAPPAPFLDRFVAGDFLIAPRTYNEFSPGNHGGRGSFDVRAAVEFSLGSLPFMLEGDYRQFRYPHNQNSATPPANSPCDGFGPDAISGDTGCVTIIGGGSQVFVPAFGPRDSEVEGRLGLKLLDPRLFVGVGYMQRVTNYGYPRLRGIGAGIEKLPDLENTFSVYGSLFYYPRLSGTCNVDVCPAGPFKLSYRALKYQVGGALNLGKGPLFIDFGYLGERLRNQQNAPSGINQQGAYAGLGLHL